MIGYNGFIDILKKFHRQILFFMILSKNYRKKEIENKDAEHPQLYVLLNDQDILDT